eukprot:6874144-Prymnesium_polylepis.1
MSSVKKPLRKGKPNSSCPNSDENLDKNLEARTATTLYKATPGQRKRSRQNLSVLVVAEPSCRSWVRKLSFLQAQNQVCRAARLDLYLHPLQPSRGAARCP